MPLFIRAVSLSLTLVLSACGGGSGSPASTSTTTPANTGNTPSNCQLSTTQRALLDAHNTARSAARSCGATTFPAVAPLAWHCGPQQAAQAHSQDMASNNFFSHTGSDGLSAGNRLTRTGYNFSGWGENIAAGQRTVDAVMQGWLNSEGHCRNIMSAGFTEMGGAAVEDRAADFDIYWTVVFGRPR